MVGNDKNHYACMHEKTLIARGGVPTLFFSYIIRIILLDIRNNFIDDLKKTLLITRIH